MKKTATFLSFIFFITFINTYAGSGEGISSVGTLSSFNNTNTIIITHGFTADDIIFPIAESRWKNYIWQFAMANAISNNRDIYLIRRGKIWKSLATASDYQVLRTSHLEDNIEILLSNTTYFTDVVDPQPNKDNIFIFDWTLESAINLDGYAEAAADVLAAALIKIGQDYPFLLQHLHFIGHSRGCVVNSEAIERLIYWDSNGMLAGISIDQNIHMTTLDPHPAGHWSSKWWTGDLVFMNDDGVNSANIECGVSGWKSLTHQVAFIDNYFQDAFRYSFIGLSDYPGLASTNILANTDLSNILEENWEAHGLVQTWYHGTVNTTAINDSFNIGLPNIVRTTEWYNPDLGQTQGFHYSLNRTGPLASISSLYGYLTPITDDYRYFNEKYIFNGDFSKAIIDSLPGWSFQGGSAETHFENGINYDLLNYIVLDYTAREITHNPLYFPANADKIWFRMSVVEPSTDDVLQFYIDENYITSFSVNNPSPFNFELLNFQIPPFYRGGVHKLKIKLLTNVSVFTKVLIDDISFYPITDYEVTAACPVDFHIYDNFGNHTGPINDSTYVEEIPGSEYYFYSDSLGDKRKTVHLRPLEENNFYIYKIESRDTSASFNFRIDDKTDTTQGTVSYQFTDIPIQPNTVAICSLLVNTQIPELLVDIDGDGNTDSTYNPVIITAIENEETNILSLPTRFELFNCFPNPFNPTTNISYSIPEVSNVTLKVYDVLGKEVVTLVNEQKSPGHYTMMFDSKNLSSGIYFYTLQTEKYSSTKKMILLK